MTNKIPVLPIVFLVAIIGFALSPFYLDWINIYNAENKVRSSLKDPNSAEFRQVKKHGLFICGEVTAKNSYGGYTGFKRFYVSENLTPTLEDETSLNFDSIYGVACQ